VIGEQVTLGGLSDGASVTVTEPGASWLIRDSNGTYNETYIVEKPEKGENLVVFRKGRFGFSATQTQVVFSVGLATFALVMILAGRWQASVGPTPIARLGGIVLGLGYILGGLACRQFMNDAAFWAILVTIGLIGGAGIGLAYVVPIAVGVKWFPDKKGMITGLAVAGFGFGALIWIYLGQGLPAWTGIKTVGLIAKMGVANAFLTFGVAFLVLVLIGSIWMKNPPEGWRPAGWVPPTATGAAAATGSGAQFESDQMLRTPQFYILWAMFIFGALAGLMVIGVIKLFGIDALKASGMDAVTASTTAGTAMALFYALANGLGRIVWGTLSDKLGRKMSLTLMMGIQGVVMLLFFHMGGTPALLYLGAALIGFNFGGNFALFPAATADYFGNKNVGKNYGWVFTAYGVGGIVGPIMAGMFKDAGLEKGVDAWHPAFIIAGIACLAAAALGLMLRPPRQHEAPAA
jgi:OFA family oxalate/formate antiporter-like MFS transporter